MESAEREEFVTSFDQVHCTYGRVSVLIQDLEGFVQVRSKIRIIDKVRRSLAADFTDNVTRKGIKDMVETDYLVGSF